MLSASGLLYNWRSRAGRSHHDPDPALDQPSSYAATAGSAQTRHPRRRGRRHLPDRNDPPRRPVVGQQLDARRLPSPHVSMEHEPPWIENHNGGESASGIISNGGSSSTLDRLRLARSSQLPGVVLQARARLEERLRGISLSGSSQTIINSGVARNEVSLGATAMNPVERETENPRERFESGQFPSDETDENVIYVNRPPGLSSEAFHNLQLEVFQDALEENNVGRAFLECSICLEKFLHGEEVIRLSCGHRFHPCCLEPWVKSCGDCPYCRTRICAKPEGFYVS